MMNQSNIKDAIFNKKCVSFIYSGCQRIAEPHVLGVKDGKIGVLIYQIGGASSSGGQLPSWRRCFLEGISGLAVLEQDFPGKRDYPSGKHSSWDEVLVHV